LGWPLWFQLRMHWMRTGARAAFGLAVITAIALAGCRAPEASEKTKAEPGQKVAKEFNPDGTLHLVRRFHPDGTPLGTLFYSNGLPNHAHYVDRDGRIRLIMNYSADGTPKSTREFDEGGKLVAEQDLDGGGVPIETNRAP